MEHEPVIGLEIHVQLATKTKIFCSCSTAFGQIPNTNTCPVCLGLPGALPVLNKTAVDMAITLGLTLHCAIQPKSIWERKNYFYQDLPKGYQITQYAHPLCLNGFLMIPTQKGLKQIRINRIHMEEDAGKSIHDSFDTGHTCVDLNRAGTPLCEIVTEPDVSSPEEAATFLRIMRSLVRYTGVCDGNMEQGSLRCDANISLRPVGSTPLGTKVELKNLNSIKHIEKALQYEIERQHMLLKQGNKIIQETRLYNEQAGITENMRTKEDAHDYRYFPDPDLVPLLVDNEWINACQKKIPELADKRAERFIREYALPEYDANLLTSEKALADYFEAVLQNYNHPKKTANWIMTELLRELNLEEKDITQCLISSKQLGSLLLLLDENKISSTIAKKVFRAMFQTGKDPEKIIQEQNLSQEDDPERIKAVIHEIIKNNPTQHEEYKQGKEKVFGFFVGQVMRAMHGKANPQTVNELLKEML